MTNGAVRVLTVGLGTMGTSHARAYKAVDGFELVGLCTLDAAGRSDLEAEFPGVARFERLDEALAALKPDAVAIAAYTEHHAGMALKALAAGAHVFCEKPLADTMRAAEEVAAAAQKSRQGFTDRLHPARPSVMEAFRRDRADARQAMVMRMNLNQQSSGSFWQVHKNLMRSTSPVVDCGVHYVDVMCQVAAPARSRCTPSARG